MSILRRKNGKPGTALVPYGEPQSRDDGWGAEAKPIMSGVWIVLKLDKRTAEGEWSKDPKGYATHGSVTTSKLAEHDSGIDAIKAFYEYELARAPDDNPEQADGRYVALDFYGGAREEALVTGGWHVDIHRAPPRLGR